jgi:hypothetical protein
MSVVPQKFQMPPPVGAARKGVRHVYAVHRSESSALKF